MLQVTKVTIGMPELIKIFDEGMMGVLFEIFVEIEIITVNVNRYLNYLGAVILTEKQPTPPHITKLVTHLKEVFGVLHRGQLNKIH